MNVSRLLVVAFVQDEGSKHVSEIRAFDVEPERRGDVMAVISPRVRG
jgi:hypothetical protein